jgi:AraC-like DNA-binding protein
MDNAPTNQSNNQSTNEPKSILAWAYAIAMALEAQGIDSKALLDQADIPHESSWDFSKRIETRKYTKLLQLACEATNDPCFVLKAVVYMHPASFHSLGYALFASSTLYDFCLRLVRFFRLLSDNALHHLSEEQDGYKLAIEILNPKLSFESQDGWTACIIHMCRTIYRPDFSPLCIELSRPEAPRTIDPYTKFFRCPVSFGHKEIAIYFSKEDMMIPLPAGNTELTRRNDEIAMEHLARLDRQDIIRQVESKIIELLPTGNCSKDRIASMLNISTRNLHYKLEQKNTSYQQLLEELRSTLGQQYIKQRDMPINEITFMLGFSDTSNFARAFRRWTGTSPTQYRLDLDKPNKGATP